VIGNRGIGAWLPTYIRETLKRRRLRAWRGSNLTHVIFLVCDHFEPRHGVKEPGQSAARMRAWHAGFGQMQQEVFSRHGHRPLHTWFYPPHHGIEHLAPLAHMAFDGLGEVELHYHHHGDTEETLRRDLLRTLRDFRRGGVLMQLGRPPVERFGFIHGDWALDNSADGEFCGVNSELSLLQELGCWGDLTMPSANACQTRKINSIYYAVDDKDRPKSHDWGRDAQSGARDQPGLLMIQGPLGLNFASPGHPRIENASLTSENWGRPDRIRAWIDCHVHVEDRPDWVFVKLHTHGAVEHDMPALFGDLSLSMHRHLNEQFNDGRRFRLHYATARQAFNLVRAAEAGEGGDPSALFDFELGPQVTSLYCLDAPHTLVACTPELIEIADIDSTRETCLRLHVAGGIEMRGALKSVRVEGQRGVLCVELAETGGPVDAVTQTGFQAFDSNGLREATCEAGRVQFVSRGRSLELRLVLT
jgi:hypothetical protein